jgi:hypothetical protein
MRSWRACWQQQEQQQAQGRQQQQQPANLRYDLTHQCVMCVLLHVMLQQGVALQCECVCCTGIGVVYFQ